MSNIDIYNNVDVSVNLSEEEKDILTRAYKVLKEIANSLWQGEADETDTFSNVSTAKECIYTFMKDDCGTNIDEKRYW